MVFGLLLCQKTLENFSDKQTDVHRVDGTRMTEKELMNYYLFRITFSLPFMIVAGILAWRCNAKEPMFLRVLITILAAMFSTIYILFYLIYRVILKHPCK
mgnify:CR=1 FL=1|tara:strand:- start:504 stop:803 length:300 start_codon:yes stop_codon:yes gene_type:complete